MNFLFDFFDSLDGSKRNGRSNSKNSQNSQRTKGSKKSKKVASTSASTSETTDTAITRPYAEHWSTASASCIDDPSKTTVRTENIQSRRSTDKVSKTVTYLDEIEDISEEENNRQYKKESLTEDQVSKRQNSSKKPNKSSVQIASSSPRQGKTIRAPNAEDCYFDRLSPGQKSKGGHHILVDEHSPYVERKQPGMDQKRTSCEIASNPRKESNLTVYGTSPARSDCFGEEQSPSVMKKRGSKKTKATPETSGMTASKGPNSSPLRGKHRFLTTADTVRSQQQFVRLMRKDGEFNAKQYHFNSYSLLDNAKFVLENVVSGQLP